MVLQALHLTLKKDLEEIKISALTTLPLLLTLQLALKIDCTKVRMAMKGSGPGLCDSCDSDVKELGKIT